MISCIACIKIWQSKDIDPEMYTVHFTAPDKDNIIIIYVDIYLYMLKSTIHHHTAFTQGTVQHVLGSKISGFG